ncbi:caspase family protein [Nostoc sp. UHCC 0302]|uniref:nSTAND1 domain-containing NTPase n=1 Tax=Nostoc sp. UHCC 0302 TaxID=3134896 RepID=UPI00311CD130
MSEFSHNLALVIGINNYGKGISPLQNAVNDAKQLVQVLRKQHGYQVWLCLDEVANLSNLNELLWKTLPEQVHSDDRLLFYFAGHGIALNADDGPKGYLIPQDAILGEVQTYLPMTQLQEALEKLPCRHFLGFLDCCFAGAFRWSSTRELLTVPEVIHQERYDRFISDPAWQVITSAAYDQKALDANALDADYRGQIGDHSPFASALLEALTNGVDLYPAAYGQPSGDGVITATKLYLNLRDRIEPSTVKDHHRQTPGIWPLKKHDKGEYIFLTPGHVLNLPPAPPLDESKNPYRGLESFEEEHSQLFFGRQGLTEKLHEFVSSQPLTVVLGASGTGKSSLVKAGLIPYLRSQPQWQILGTIRPGESPVKALNNILLRESLSASLATWSQVYPQSKLLLVIDQIEELITLCQDEQERQKFLNLLAQAVVKYSDNFRLVLTLRSDFEPQLRNSALEPYWQSARFIVPAMTREELRACIEEPASKRVIYFEPHNLVDTLIDEVAQMPGALPLLSFTLSELYLKYLKAVRQGKRNNRAITQADYEQLGGVIQSLTQRANSEYEELVNDNQAYEQTIRHVMLRMVAVGGGELARRRVPLFEMEYPEPENGRVKEVIRRFSAARLLVQGQDTEGQAYVEPAHDALVRGWPKLLAWQQDEAESLILQRQLTPAAFEWQSVKSREIPSGWQAKVEPVLDWLDSSCYVVENSFDKINAQLLRLWRRTQSQQQQHREKQVQFLWNANPYLDVLNEKLKSNENWFNQLEAEFVQRSVVQKRKNIAWRSRIAIAVILGLSGLTLYALFNLRNAQIGQASAFRENAEVDLGTPALDGAIASLRAGTMLNQPLVQLFKPEKLQNQVQGTLQKAVYTVKERNRLEGHQGTVRSSFSPDGQLIASAGEDGIVRLWNLQGQAQVVWKTNLVRYVDFSPDGQLLVTGTEDGIGRLWNLQGQLLAELKGHQSRVRSIRFSPNGQLIASGSDDDTIRIWNLQGQQLRGWKANQNSVNSVSFSPNGQLLATAGKNSTISLWNLQGKLLGKPFTGHQQPVSSISFSPDGQLLVSGGQDKTIRLWNLQGQQLGKAFTGHQGRIWCAMWSPDGQQVVSAAGDGTVRLWNLQGQELQRFAGHQGPVRSVRFSPDGQLLTSGGDDKTVRVWNLHSQQVTELSGHQKRVLSINFSSDGQRVTTGGDDGIIRVWNLQGQQLLGWTAHQGKRIHSISFSPDGQLMGSAGDDSTVRLWNLHGQQLTALLMAESLSYPKHICDVSFSPDSKLVASVGENGIVIVWDWQKRWQLAKFSMVKFPREKHFCKVSFSPDGKLLASTGNDGITRVWNWHKQQLITNVSGHLGPVSSVAFSPDSQRLVSAGDDGTIRLWNLQGNKPFQEFVAAVNFGAAVNSVAFSSDGKMIASGDQKGNVQLWDWQNREQFAAWKAHQGEVRNVSFSKDGKMLASAGDDSIAKLWPIQSYDELMKQTCNEVQDYLQNHSQLPESDHHLCHI